MISYFKKNYLLFIVVGIFIILSNKFFNDRESYIEEYNLKINKLETKVDSLHSINDELTFTIDTLNTQISKLDTQLESNESQITNLQYEIKNQVNTVDSYHYSELEKFFTNRYRHHLDSITKTSR